VAAGAPAPLQYDCSKNMEQSAGASRERIVEAAIGLFSDAGYAGTSMRDIATAVGVLPGSLYAHIGGKEELLVEILEAGADRFLGGVPTIAAVPEPRARLRKAVELHLAAIAVNPKQALILFHQWTYLTGAGRARMLDRRLRYRELFTEVVADGIETGVFSDRLQAGLAGLSILGSLIFAAEWLEPRGAENLEVLSEQMTEMILSGLRADGALSRSS